MKLYFYFPILFPQNFDDRFDDGGEDLDRRV